jgi:predicted NBD/HSP70 family sugar kinase
MTLIPGGRGCSCGKRGCLEAYISTARISEDLGIELDEFFAELDKKNQKYLKIWEEYLDCLCRGLSNLYMVFDTDIILGGHLTPYLESYMNQITEKLNSLNSFASMKEAGNHLKLTDYYSRANAVGAALQWIIKFINNI